MAYYMENMTVRDMETAITKTKTVIIPIGVVEQHGYHLPLSTDIHNAVEVLKRAAEKLNAVIAPPVNYCYSGGELLGTVNINPNVFGLYMGEICEEFLKMGFKDIILYMGHGGTENYKALKNSLQMLLKRDHERAKEVSISLIGCYQMSPTWMEGFGMEPEHDFHAGMIETSLMLYWHPELVRGEIVMDEDYIAKMMRTDCDWYATSEKLIDSPYILPHEKQREEIKVGVMGFPEKASAELGEKVCVEMVENLITYVDMINNKRETFYK